MEKTYGEKLVRSGFNTSESQDVKEIKELAAKLIDRIREVVPTGTANLTDPEAIERAQQIGRHVSLAITHIETGAMFAVKAATA
jgi:hypothetical protein